MKKPLNALYAGLLTVLMIFVFTCCDYVSDKKRDSESNTASDTAETIEPITSGDTGDESLEESETESEEESESETESESGEVVQKNSAVHENVAYDNIEKTAWGLVGQKPSLPSTGDVEVLVIPISFTNTDYEKYGTKTEIIERLEKAFNGTEEQTGWYSLSGYYKEVSYGKLNIHANISEVYETGEAYDVKKGVSGKTDCDYLLGALEYFDDRIDYSVYDQNDDGKIDCVYMVYLAPYYSSSDLWWAYFYSYYGKTVKYDNIEVCDYLWFSYEFFDEYISVYRTENGKRQYVYVDINCETLIHETGHALGLDDYYDYEDGGVVGGLAYFDMMDGTQGDHCPYSKAILGWISPTVVYEKDYTATLRSFASTGDTIIISKNDGGTYFEEYYMIALYTPTGVNEIKKEHQCGIPEHTGIMIWHVDATLIDKEDFDEEVDTEIDITLYNNGGASRKLITLVCADGSDEIDTTDDYEVSDKDLYAAKRVITGLKWYDGTDVGVTVTIGEFTSAEETEQTKITLKYGE
ncbi:MAG: hypothetical protein J6N93_05440 [Clostridia bacterium]|nr:hypothetical protein [Clostridia bacterium]